MLKSGSPYAPQIVAEEPCEVTVDRGALAIRSGGLTYKREGCSCSWRWLSRCSQSNTMEGSWSNTSA